MVQTLVQRHVRSVKLTPAALRHFLTRRPIAVPTHVVSLINVERRSATTKTYGGDMRNIEWQARKFMPHQRVKRPSMEEPGCGGGEVFGNLYLEGQS